ncbi:TIGR04104 family putative zinc finger protein [Gottfriedia sp. NPDC057948]|uniref:TIGR04104 family putative zinc finger protein n=1 Tax=Gottfriedia sp. NPDC057948 TaxID=3346287 RepID=UPI0036D943D8
MLRIKCDECHNKIKKKAVLKSLFTKKMTVSCNYCKSRYKVTEKSLVIFVIIGTILGVLHNIFKHIYSISEEYPLIYLIGYLVIVILILFSVVKFKKIT